MNVVDVVVIFVAVLAGFRGWRRGFLSQLFELGGGFLGLIAGVVLGPRIASSFTEEAGLQGALISVFVVFMGLTIGQTIGFLIGHRSGRAASSAKLGGVDQGIGVGFGVVVWLLSFWLMGSLLVQAPVQSLASALNKSSILRATNDLMPRPPNVLAYLRQYLDTSGFPQVFAGLPRSLSPPVDLPTQKQARRAIEAAQASTVRIVATACGGTQLGSGWIVDGDSVVTNAHVVAGGTDFVVQELGRGDHEAHITLFDPDIDVAVLQVGGLTGPSLSLTTDEQPRGTPGATLGYPGSRNGEFVGKRAAVQASYEATGRDIYGRQLVTREVYELRSPVRQGDSGGPFVLPSGKVAGVVFAASTTDGATGYALTGAEVEDQVRDGARSTERVGSGRCTR